MPVQPPDLLKNLFNALPVSAQGGVNDPKHYVKRSQSDEYDSVAILKQKIAWNDDPSGHTYLFSGLRGAGKTTELNRLLSELRADGVAAFYCDASAYLNLNDPQVTLPDLMMTALAGLADAVRATHGAEFLKDSIWQRTKRLLHADVVIKPKFKVTTGVPQVAQGEVSLEASLQENPDFRKELNTFAQSASGFYDQAQLYAQEVCALVRQQTQCTKIVLVVDSLERISAPSGDEGKLFDSLKNVFFNESARLRLPGISVVYSAPPYLYAVLPNVGSGFSHCETLTNFKVIKRTGEATNPVEAAPDGLDQMLAIVRQRFADVDQAFSQDVVRHLAWMSGGNVRRFFDLVRTAAGKAALSKAALPIADINHACIQHTLNDAAQPLQWLTATDREWLGRFMQDSKNPSAHIQNAAKDLPSIIRLFDHSMVLNYQNGEVWYQVPELVRRHV